MNRNLKAALAVVAMAAGCFAGAAHADYPDRPIHMVVPYPPGGTNDKLIRILGDHLNKELKQPIVVENRAGAATAIGAQYVERSAPDGYTVLAGSASTFFVNPLVRKDVTYSLARDFKTVAIIAEAPMAFLANPNSPYKSMKDIIRAAQKSPGKVMYATGGTGTSMHLVSEGFAANAGIHLQHVPYQGDAPAMLALIRGDVPLMTEVVSGAAAMVKAGQARPLAVGTAQRLPLWPDVPTVGEATGMQNFIAWTWWSLQVPRATPDAAVDKLRKAVYRVLDEPSFQAAFKQDGLIFTVPRSAKEIQDFLAQEGERWSALYKTVLANGGIKP